MANKVYLKSEGGFVFAVACEDAERVAGYGPRGEFWMYTYHSQNGEVWKNGNGEPAIRVPVPVKLESERETTR